MPLRYGLLSLQNLPQRGRGTRSLKESSQTPAGCISIVTRRLPVEHKQARAAARRWTPDRQHASVQPEHVPNTAGRTVLSTAKESSAV